MSFQLRCDSIFIVIAERTFVFILLLATRLYPASSSQTFTNPLLGSGPDPWVTQKDGVYYYMNTTGNNLTIWKTKSIPDLKDAEKKVVWTPPADKPYSQQLWAPELHFLRGRWYIYFAADSGQNEGHRIWSISNKSPDPLSGAWSEPKKLATPDDHWAIDATVFENKGTLFMIWSGWQSNHDGVQNLYIARMRDPSTLEGKRIRISRPQYEWETVGDLPGRHVDVNEGPEVLFHGNSLLLTYSASGCWTDSYSIGEMTAFADSNLLKPGSWRKIKRPALSTSGSAGTFGPGHNAFFKSPDGTEDWVIYHANPQAQQGCKNNRSPRAQKLWWRPDGTADLGVTVPLGQPISRPSGDLPGLGR